LRQFELYRECLCKKYTLFFFPEQEYNEDDNSKSIDIEHTDDEEDDEPNEYDLIDDIEEEGIQYDDDEDEEEEYNFDDETDSDEEDSEDDQDSEYYDYEELNEQEEINNECNERKHKSKNNVDAMVIYLFNRKHHAKHLLFKNT
jgi:hypothetical protein